MTVILTTWEAEIRKISLRSAQANSSQDLISKITRAKWTGDVARVVEHLFCKFDLSSNPSPTREKKNSTKILTNYF
jgi:hypothetical protein